MSSAAVGTWALSLTLQLSGKHIVHTELCKALEIPHNWTDFRHGPPEAAHVPSSQNPLHRKERQETSRALEKPIDCEYVIIPLASSVEKHASSSG